MILKRRKPQDRFDVEKLECYGCAHSAAAVEYPSHPSGEWACGHCIRAYKHGGFGKREDDDKDMYITLDRMRGQCGVCEADRGFATYMCGGCHQAVEMAKDTEV